MSEVISRSALVEARVLSKVYVTPATRVAVFEGLSWSVPQGRLVAVIGPSGAGKSTLLHLLGGLDRPTSGSVVVDGTDVFSLSPLELAGFRNRRIGFVFQFHHLLPEFTVLENAMMPGVIRGAPREESEAAARQEEMGQGDGDPVGGVGRLGGAGQPEQLRHHVADLRLERRAASHDRLLDQSRRVLGDRHRSLLRRQQDDAASVAHHHRGPRVPGMKDALHHHHIGVMAGEQSRDAVVNEVWALLHGLASLEIAGALGPPEAARPLWDDAVSSILTAFGSRPKRMTAR